MEERFEQGVRLLREHLSPMQLSEFDVSRDVEWHPGADMRSFNIVGSKGGLYSVTGLINAEATVVWVALGFNIQERADWCVRIYSPDNSHRGVPLTSDQMLAFKISLETDEVDFLKRARPQTAQAVEHHKKMLPPRVRPSP